MIHESKGILKTKDRPLFPGFENPSGYFCPEYSNK
jgi:hypothetical protein